MTGSASCDRSLPSRVERAIVAERRAFAMSTSAARIEAGVLDIAGGCAVYTGHGLFFNRVLGLGLDRAVTDEDLSAIESFHADRGAATEIELASESARDLVAWSVGGTIACGVSATSMPGLPHRWHRPRQDPSTWPSSTSRAGRRDPLR